MSATGQPEEPAWRRSLLLRPLVPASVCFAGGIALSAWSPAIALTLWLVISASIWFFAGRSHRSLAVLSGFVAAGALVSAGRAGPRADDVSRFIGRGYIEIEGRVAGDVESQTRGSRLPLDTERVRLADGRSLATSGRIQLYLSRDAAAVPLEYRDRVRLKGLLKRPAGAADQGGFDYAAYLARQGVFAEMRLTRRGDLQVLDADPGLWPTIGRLAGSCRASIQRAFRSVLPPVEAELLAGIVMGQRTRIPGRIQDDFSATGASHILASSGMNVGIVAALVFWLARRLGLRRRRAAIPAMAAVAFYSLVAGMKPSVARADIMALIVLAGLWLEKEPDLPSALAAAALILLALSPGALWDAGFQLSFIVVAALIALMPHLDRSRIPLNAGRSRPVRSLYLAGGWCVSAILVSLVAQLSAAPVTAYHFNYLSGYAILANALILPVIGLLLAGGFLLWGAWLVWTRLGEMAALFLSPLLAYVMGVAGFAAALPGASWSVSSGVWPLVAAGSLTCLYGLLRALSPREQATP